MIEITELQDREIETILNRADYGHLACSADDEPYVVPIHFAYVKPVIYVYTTEGKKTAMIAKNPHVCLQIEEVEDNQNWVSVIVFGKAEPVTGKAQQNKAVKAVSQKNPTLTPAISIHWMDNWIRENFEVIYRIVPRMMTGRKTLHRGIQATVVPRRPTAPIY